MEVDVVNMEGQKVRTLELPAKIFEAPINVDLMHQAYVRQMANARLGTHKTKTRSEVAGGGRKPWKQKGTGRARAGSIRSPLWKGGGVIFGPKPRSYAKDMPRKMRRLALRSALTVKAEDIIPVTEWKFEKPSTKTLNSLLSKMGATGKVLMIIHEHDEWLERSSNNLPNVNLILARNLNVKDLLNCDKIVATTAALDQMEEVFAQ